MSRPEPIKNTHDEREIFVGRMLVAVIAMLLMCGLLVYRYFNLQILQYESYRVQSDRNRVHLQSIGPTRGLIFDRNGVLLADNRPSYTLTVVKERVGDLDAGLALLQELLQIETDDIEKLRQLLGAGRPFEQIPLKFRLSPEDIAILAVNRYRMPGFEVKAELARYYPQGEYFAHAVGYVGRINEAELKALDAVDYAGTHVIGKTGIERYYEDLLHGAVGYENVETNARGEVLRVLDRTDPLPGKDLILNIDATIQKVAHDALQGKRAAVVALDPRDGAVIAFVSTPGFDPNLFVGGISGKEYRLLNESPDLPLYNRATMGQYPPGSTIKPIVGLAGLEYEVVTPSTVINDPGYYRLPNDRRNYRDWKRGGHGRKIDIHIALEQSCDIYYYDLAYKLGVDQIHEFGDLFGLGKPSGIDLPVERPGLLPSREWKRANRNEPWYPGETLNIGIGQGYMLTTPLQLAVATAAIANRGKLLQPKILKSVSGEVPDPPETTQFEIKNPVNWDTISTAMEAVVHGARGTARGISKDVQYRIAGKTGTSQVVGIAQGEEYDSELIAERNRDHALFIAYAPAESPRIAIAVIVENGEHGSTTAAPIARTVMDAYLLGIFPPPPEAEAEAEATALPGTSESSAQLEEAVLVE
jgi:penicillin-binding protein 2